MADAATRAMYKRHALMFQKTAETSASVARGHFDIFQSATTHRQQDIGLNGAVFYQGEAEAAARGARDSLFRLIGEAA